MKNVHLFCDLTNETSQTIEYSIIHPTILYSIIHQCSIEWKWKVLEERQSLWFPHIYVFAATICHYYDVKGELVQRVGKRRVYVELQWSCTLYHTVIIVVVTLKSADIMTISGARNLKGYLNPTWIHLLISSMYIHTSITTYPFCRPRSRISSVVFFHVKHVLF